MHFKLVSALAFAIAVAAIAPGRRGPGTIPLSQCNSGDVLCCNSVQSASSSQVALIFGLLGIVPTDLTGLVGLTCSPVNVPGGSCTAQPVCCSNHSFNGLVALGCVPIDVNL